MTVRRTSWRRAAHGPDIEAQVLAKPLDLDPDGNDWYMRLQPCPRLEASERRRVMDRIFQLLWSHFRSGLVHGDLAHDIGRDVYLIGRDGILGPLDGDELEQARSAAARAHKEDEAN